MPTKTLPLGIVNIRRPKTTTKYGSPAKVPLSNDSRILMRANFASIPAEATITNAVVRFLTVKNHSTTVSGSIYPVTKNWNASQTWKTQPGVGAVLSVVTKNGSTVGTAWDWNVTSWAVTRDPKGLMLLSAQTPGVVLAGAPAGTAARPVLIVDYAILPKVPGTLKPTGGAVSVPKPVLSYAGDPEMTEQYIEWQVGTGTIQNTGWVPASAGYLDAATVAGFTAPAAGQTVNWRATTRGPNGTSTPSAWAAFTYQLNPAVVITSPPSSTTDGSPPMTWTVSGTQTQWAAWLYDDETNTLLDKTAGWVDEADTRDWTPSKGVKVPGGKGRFELAVRDAVTPRVKAGTAETYTLVKKSFVTDVGGSGQGVNTLQVDTSASELVPRLTGTRAAGVPDFVALVRDDVYVPIWYNDGEDVGLSVPGAAIFSGTSFSVRDFTAPPRKEHTYKVVPIVNGTPSATNPTVKHIQKWEEVLLINPRTAEVVRVRGIDGRPEVKQETVENAVIHVPVSDGGIVETVRRRQVRMTRNYEITGVMNGTDAAIVERWATEPSGNLYRLVFGRMNVSVILGDYNPFDILYGSICEEDRVEFEIKAWSRLKDF